MGVGFFSSSFFLLSGRKSNACKIFSYNFCERHRSVTAFSTFTKDFPVTFVPVTKLKKKGERRRRKKKLGGEIRSGKQSGIARLLVGALRGWRQEVCAAFYYCWSSFVQLHSVQLACRNNPAVGSLFPSKCFSILIPSHHDAGNQVTSRPLFGQHHLWEFINLHPRDATRDCLSRTKLTA